MKIHITLTAKDIHKEELPGKVAVVIDVLRATSVIITALANGASWVKTVASIEEAIGLRSENIVLGGERFALPPEGFDFGNSPLDYTSDRILNKGVVLSTTNGTLAVSRCGSADELLIGAFLNQKVLSDYLIRQGKSVELICAGTNGEFSLDDFLCAGMICSTLEACGNMEFDDLGRLSIEKWESARTDIHAALSVSTHYNVLKTKGFVTDLDYCLTPDSRQVLVARNPANGWFEKVG